MPLNGKPRIHATLPRLGAYFDISPDGKQIAYHAKATTGSATHIYILDVATKVSRQLSDDGVGGLHPAWSPDGAIIAYVSQRKLRLKNAATGAERILVSDALLKELPTWAPDGKTIAYQGSADNEWSYELFHVDVGSGVVNQLTRSRGLDVNPVFTADGHSIIFVSDRETSRDQPTLYIMNRDGTDVRRDLTAGQPVFLPNISLSAVILDQPELEAVATQDLPGPTVNPDAAAGSATASVVTATPISNETEISYSISDLMKSLGEKQSDIDRALDGNHIFYQVRTPTGVLLHAKTLGEADPILIAALPHSSLSRPDVLNDRTGLFFKFVDQSGRATHIIRLRRNEAAQDLVTLPLVPDLAFENFDVTEDASKVFFDVRVDEQLTILTYNIVAGGALPALPADQGGMYPALSPDQRTLAYVAAGKLHLLNLETSASSVFTDDPPLKQHPAWSPDGTKIVYHASESTETGFDLYVADVATKITRAVGAAAGDDMTPSFGPGGQTIVYTSDRDAPGFGALYSVRPDGGNAQLDILDVIDVLNVR